MRRPSVSTIERLTSPNSLLIRVLALLGVIFLVERASSFYYISAQETPFSVTHGHRILQQERIVSYDSENSGFIRQTGERKAIIVASTTWENTSWVREHFSDWNLNIYVVNDDNAELTVSRQGGNEAAVFLTYIINNYYNLPDYMVFLHAERYQWHNDDPMYDGIPAVKHLQLPHVKKVGYASLRCTWTPGCPDEIFPAQGIDDQRPDPFGIRHAYTEAFGQFFPDVELPEVVAAPCCAQFAVSRAQVRKRPIVQFERVRQWLWETTLAPAVSGRVMEYLWHILFSLDAVSCPKTEQCFCERFGYCDLDCPDDGFCEGRYWFTPFMSTFPPGWPFVGQGTKGFPSYGWWQSTYPNETWGLEYTDMNNRLDPDLDLNGATGEGMTHEALSQSDEELKLLRHDEDYGEVFKEEWELDHSGEQEDEKENGSGDADVTITTDKEALIEAMKQKEEDERPSDEWKEAEEERKMAAQVGQEEET